MSQLSAGICRALRQPLLLLGRLPPTTHARPVLYALGPLAALLQETYSRLHFPVVCGGCGCFFVLRTDDDDLRRQLVCLPCHRLRRAAANRLREERAATLRRRPLLPVPGLLAAGLVLVLQHARLRNNLLQ